MSFEGVVIYCPDPDLHDPASIWVGVVTSTNDFSKLMLLDVCCKSRSIRGTFGGLGKDGIPESTVCMVIMTLAVSPIIHRYGSLLL